MSLCRRQEFIDAPVEVVWDLISDIEQHPEWWPRVVEVQHAGLEPGDTYRQLTQTPLGKDEMQLLIESREDLPNLRIRCLNTGTFLRFEVAGSRRPSPRLIKPRSDGPEPDRVRRWAILDSNQGPRPYQRRALTN